MNAQQAMTERSHLSKFGVIAAQACIVLAGVYQCYMCMPLQEPTRTVRTVHAVCGTYVACRLVSYYQNTGESECFES